MQRILLAFMLCLIPLSFAYAMDRFPALPSSLPKMEVVGEGNLSKLVFNVYDIALYAPNGAYEPSQPQAITIRYHIKLDGYDIADRSVEEMQRQHISEAKLARWHKAMMGIFPAVNDGSLLTAFHVPGGKTQFYLNNRHYIGAIADPEFGAAFFGIWLKQTTSEPELRLQLIGSLS
ncbi:MAG: hypothetical protein EB059_02935 [Alphaproteobacteria bacterium]|nr:hypothetical protein [Alphaproteobacteria bacterium]